MDESGKFFLGACAVGMGICGLFVASRAGDGVGYYGGLVMAAFCAYFVMHLIKAATEHGEED